MTESAFIILNRYFFLDNSFSSPFRMEKQFEFFKNIEGDIISRLRKTGYTLESTNEVEMSTFEDFKRVISRSDCVSKEKLTKDLKKIYKNHISLEGMRKFLAIGNEDDRKEVEDAIRILPLNEDSFQIGFRQ